MELIEFEDNEKNKDWINNLLNWKKKDEEIKSNLLFVERRIVGFGIWDLMFIVIY